MAIILKSHRLHHRHCHSGCFRNHDQWLVAFCPFLISLSLFHFIEARLPSFPLLDSCAESPPVILLGSTLLSAPLAPFALLSDFSLSNIGFCRWSILSQCVYSNWATKGRDFSHPRDSATFSWVPQLFLPVHFYAALSKVWIVSSLHSKHKIGGSEAEDECGRTYSLQSIHAQYFS